MEDKLFDLLDDLNIRDTRLLLDKDINVSLDYCTRKRIEKSIKKKTGYYNKDNRSIDKIKNILGGILMKKNIALALSLGVILSLAGGGYAYARNPVAYVSMDINPSVELGVNAFEKVVSVEAYNEDGEKILKDTDLVKSNIDDAVSIVISNAISQGYINEDGSSAIEITTATDKEKVATKLDEYLKDVAEETLNDNNLEAEVETEKVALARRDEARKLGLTPGKLNLIEKLQELDPTINVEDYKDSSVKEIQKKTKELRKTNKSEETNTEEATLSETSIDLEKNKNSSNNGNSKKEENSNINSIKEEDNNADTGKKNTDNTTTEKQNSSNNVNSQENNNSSKSEKVSNSDLESNSSNSNSSKSNNSSSGNSNSQNNEKSKNN